jgi:hypothetical protein
VKAAGRPIALAILLAAAGGSLAGCPAIEKEIQAVLGGAPAPDGGAVSPAAGPGRSIQGIPIYSGAEVVYAGYLESDYQIELASRTGTVADVLRYYDATLRLQGWQLVPPVAEGAAQVLRGTRDGRLLTARFEPREVGTAVQFLLVTAPAAQAPDSYAPIRDLAVPEDGGIAAAADAGPACAALPDGVPQPTGYRLVSHRALGAGSWEVVLEVDASADQALGRLTAEMAQMGWRFGGGSTRAPGGTPAAEGTVVGSRGGVTVTVSVSETTRAAGGLVATLRLVGSASPR